MLPLFIASVCAPVCVYCMCMNVYDSQLRISGTSTTVLGAMWCVCVGVYVVISAADHVFQASDEAKQLWQRAVSSQALGPKTKRK